MEEKNILNEEEMTIEVVTFVDDEGNEFDMEIVKTFEHKTKSYAVLTELDEECEGDCKCDKGEECECDCDEQSLYIFEIINGEDGEEFIAIEDDGLLEELAEIVETIVLAEEADDAEEAK